MNFLYWTSELFSAAGKKKLVAILKGVWVGIGIFSILLTFVFHALYSEDSDKVMELLEPYVVESMPAVNESPLYSLAEHAPGTKYTVATSYALIVYAGYVAQELNFLIAERNGTTVDPEVLTKYTALKDTVVEIVNMRTLFPLVTWLRFANTEVMTVIDVAKAETSVDKEQLTANVEEVTSLLSNVLTFFGLITIVSCVAFGFCFIACIDVSYRLVRKFIADKIYRLDRIERLRKSAKYSLIVGIIGYVAVIVGFLSSVIGVQVYIVLWIVVHLLAVYGIAMYNKLMTEVNHRVELIVGLFGHPGRISMSNYLKFLGVKVEKYDLTVATEEEKYNAICYAKGMTAEQFLYCFRSYKESGDTTSSYIYWDQDKDLRQENPSRKDSLGSILLVTLLLTVLGVLLLYRMVDVLWVRLLTPWIPIVVCVGVGIMGEVIEPRRAWDKISLKELASTHARTYKQKLQSIGMTESDPVYNRDVQATFIAQCGAYSLEDKIELLGKLIHWDNDYPMSLTTVERIEVNDD